MKKCEKCCEREGVLPEAVRDRYTEKGKEIYVFGTQVKDLSIEDLYAVIGLLEHTYEQYRDERERELKTLKMMAEAIQKSRRTNEN